MRKFFNYLFGLVMVCTVTSQAIAALRYDVTYRGVLSGMQTLDIADAVLSTEPTAAAGLQRSELQISSAGHQVVESVYPFRYRVRSLYRENGAGAVAFELFKQTRRSKQEVYFVDSVSRRLVTYRRSGDGPDLPETIAKQLGVEQRHRQRGEGMQIVTEQIFDRLSLLQHLGSLPMAVGHDFAITVTDGDETFAYRVRVDKKEPQQAAGRTWETWRLRLDATDEEGEPAHRPLYLWLTNGPDRLLVRAEARHPIGRFAISLLETDARKMNADDMQGVSAPQQDFISAHNDSG